MADMIFKTYRADCKEVDDADGSLNLFIPVSANSVDRDGEIVEPLAFKKTLPKFMKRPVLVSSHDYRDLTSQIGEWEKLKITENGLEGRPRYYIGQGNEQADWGFKLASKGMAAFSIGFIPKEWVDGDGVKEPRRTYKEVELLEISQVIVPSNREAIQSIRSKSVDPITNKLMDDVLADKELVTKPEETDAYIRIPVDRGDHEGHRIRTIDISEKEGIKAIYCGTDKVVMTYLFLKEAPYNWTMARAKEWVRKHGKSAIYQCTICDKYFLDSPSAHRKVCSTKCGYKHLSQLNSGENHPQWKGGKSQNVCEQCGEIFETHRRGNNQKYCSITCHNKAMEIDKEKGNCLICGKEFIFYASNPQIYCSRECFYEGHKEFLAKYNKTHPLTEAQEEALGRGRLNGFGSYSIEAEDGHIVQSAFEKIFDDWLYQNKIEHNIQVRVSPDRYWTCDFVLIRNDGETLWVECDGLGEIRPKKFQFEEKLNYYKSSDFHFLVIDKKNEDKGKEEIKRWIEEAEESNEIVAFPSKNKTSQEEIIDEIDYLKSLIEKEGLSEKAKESATELIRIMCSDDLIRELTKRLPANDKIPKDTIINFSEIQEAIKRMASA